MNDMAQPPRVPFDATQITRPDPLLMHYYFYCALLSLPAFPLVLIQSWMRYATLRYRFDDEGVSMRWGVFFRNEVNLTYRRIQDIHLTANIVQRWMGLAKISLQTAAGSSQAEIVIEGVLQAEQLRDFLYARMRGAKDGHLTTQPVLAEIQNSAIKATETASATGVGNDEALRTLIDIRDSLQSLVRRQGGAS